MKKKRSHPSLPKIIAHCRKQYPLVVNLSSFVMSISIVFIICFEFVSDFELHIYYKYSLCLHVWNKCSQGYKTEMRKKLTLSFLSYFLLYICSVFRKEYYLWHFLTNNLHNCLKFRESLNKISLRIFSLDIVEKQINL